MSISSIGISGNNPGDFAETNNCPISPSTLAANTSCTINMAFTPTSTGTRTATLSISDNASGSPRTASLTGTGTAPAVSLSVTNLNFGNVHVGTTTAPKTVTVSNAGNTPLAITGTNSGDFAQTNNCGSSVAAGANCAISVTFTPTATGPRTAAVTITDNASGSPQQISLKGQGG